MCMCRQHADGVCVFTDVKENSFPFYLIKNPLKKLSLIFCRPRDNSRKDDFVLFCSSLPIAGRIRLN